jgi:hypothetical protein
MFQPSLEYLTDIIELFVPGILNEHRLTVRVANTLYLRLLAYVKHISKLMTLQYGQYRKPGNSLLGSTEERDRKKRFNQNPTKVAR